MIVSQYPGIFQKVPRQREVMAKRIVAQQKINGICNFPCAQIFAKELYNSKKHPCGLLYLFAVKISYNM